jgi:hypothetical protein
MKKLKLNVEALAIEQFQVEAAAPQEKGTVLGNAATTHWYTAPCLYCPNMPATARC